jgi:GNAT superfamily N-acetyltransferase
VEGARLASPADLAVLAALCRAAHDELAPTRGGEVFLAYEGRAEPYEQGLAAELDDPERIVLAGLIDEAIIGFASASLVDLRDGTRLAVIGDLFVEPGAREVGVGEALMDALLAWSRTKGCAGVDATALPGNRHTKNFFETNGFTARLLVMHRRLAADAET